MHIPCKSRVKARLEGSEVTLILPASDSREVVEQYETIGTSLRTNSLGLADPGRYTVRP